jgi:signal transduction histidine kinase
MKQVLPLRFSANVEGFSERSKIVAKLDIPQSFTGLSKEMELSIFRVVQECLTNIHRHAGSPTAAIRITQDDACLRVEIEDAGKGIPPEKESLFILSAHTGVGLRGMRERLRQLGGTLQIQSNGHGTQVIATLPVTRTPVVAPPEVVGSAPSGALGGTVACLSRTEPNLPQARSWHRTKKSGVQISTPQ